jgi:hypothetical protein
MALLDAGWSAQEGQPVSHGAESDSDGQGTSSLSLRDKALHVDSDLRLIRFFLSGECSGRETARTANR